MEADDKARFLLGARLELNVGQQVVGRSVVRIGVDLAALAAERTRMRHSDTVKRPRLASAGWLPVRGRPSTRACLPASAFLLPLPPFFPSCHRFFLGHDVAWVTLISVCLLVLGPSRVGMSVAPAACQDVDRRNESPALELSGYDIARAFTFYLLSATQSVWPGAGHSTLTLRSVCSPATRGRHGGWAPG